MVALFTLLAVITVSIIVVRIGAEALTMTGVSRDVAIFQAQSAFSGVGFTTAESELVATHPVRRRIVRILMLMGTAGITTVIASLVLTFYRGTGQAVALRMLIGVAGLVALWVASTSSLLNAVLTRLIKAGLKRWTILDVSDYARLLAVGRGYAVSEIEVDPEDWLCNRKLSELSLPDEGVLILGVHRAQGEYVGAPSGKTTILPGDTLTCYGQEIGRASCRERV